MYKETSCRYIHCQWIFPFLFPFPFKSISTTAVHALRSKKSLSSRLSALSGPTATRGQLGKLQPQFPDAPPSRINHTPNLVNLQLTQKHSKDVVCL